MEHLIRPVGRRGQQRLRLLATPVSYTKPIPSGCIAVALEPTLLSSFSPNRRQLELLGSRGHWFLYPWSILLSIQFQFQFQSQPAGLAVLSPCSVRFSRHSRSLDPRPRPLIEDTWWKDPSSHYHVALATEALANSFAPFVVSPLCSWYDQSVHPSH